MNLTFVNYDAIVVRDPHHGDLQEALSQVGAIRQPHKNSGDSEAWYELTPEPIYAQLPYDPEHFKLDLPKLDLLGTAAVRLNIKPFPPKYIIIVFGVHTTVDTLRDTSLGLPPWRDLVASPGKTVLRRSSKKVDWSNKGPELARVGSSGRVNPDGLNLAQICRHRAGVLADVLNSSDSKMLAVPSKSGKNGPFGMSIGNAVNISGIEFPELKSESLSSLMKSAPQCVAQRMLLDVLLERIRELAVKANGDFKSPHLSDQSFFEELLSRHEVELHNIAEYITLYSHLPTEELAATINRHLHIPFDAHRCHWQIADLRHTLTKLTTIHCCSVILGSIQDLSVKVEGSAQTVEERLDDTSIEILHQFSYLARSNNVRNISIALSVSAFLLAGSVTLDGLEYGLVTVGLGFALIGLIWNRLHNRHGD